MIENDLSGCRNVLNYFTFEIFEIRRKLEGEVERMKIIWKYTYILSKIFIIYSLYIQTR